MALTTITHSLTQNQKMALNNNHPFTHSKSEDGFKQKSPIHSLKIKRWL
jgi:hypothetical protein